MDNEKDLQSLDSKDLDKISGGYKTRKEVRRNVGYGYGNGILSSEEHIFCDRCGVERSDSGASKNMFFSTGSSGHLCINCIKELKNELGEDFVKDILLKGASYLPPKDKTTIDYEK